MKQGTTNSAGITLSQISLLLFCSVMIGGAVSADDEDDKGIATAPTGTDVFESSFEGTWFVDRKLKKRYDGLLTDVQSLEQRLRKGDISADEARRSISKLRKSLATVRAEIDKQKQLVSPFKIATQKTEGEIELGDERLLVVTADRIKVVGWDKPYVKYAMVKKVLSTGKPVDKHLAEIKIIHELKVAPELVGKTDTEMKAWRDDFLKPKTGEEQTPDQLAQKKKVWERDFAHGPRFQPFVGREVDTLRIEGLTAPEGNQHIEYEIKRPDGGGQVGGRWRRHATVTLYVPKCTALLLRGCQMGMDISGVKAHLIMTDSGSQNRDYNGTFAIRDHVGKLTLNNVPMDAIERVAGDIAITSTIEMVNTGNHHLSGEWIASTPPARRLRISAVKGNLTVRSARSDLHVDDVEGVLDIRNDFGDTQLATKSPMVDGNHRIVSQSGLVRFEFAGETNDELPVFAATRCGTAATNLGRSTLDDLNVTYVSSIDGMRCEWRSLFTKIPQDNFSARSALHQRPDAILANRKRTHGLDLISVAGRVEYRQR